MSNMNFLMKVYQTMMKSQKIRRILLIGLTLTALITGVSNADNITVGIPTGAVTSPVDWTWQVELEPGSNVFTAIVRVNEAG